MNEQSLDAIITQYSSTHLICDGSYPLINNSSLQEEAMLYNLTKPELTKLMEEFALLTDKDIHLTMDISTLSGGQKIILMVLLALYSPSDKLVFINLFNSLDAKRSSALNALIDSYKTNKSEILII